jgi:hypothetical protein
MAGDEPDSWKSVLSEKGFFVECVLRGLGELPAVQGDLRKERGRGHGEHCRLSESFAGFARTLEMSVRPPGIRFRRREKGEPLVSAELYGLGVGPGIRGL